MYVQFVSCDLQRSPGDCGLGQTTANLGGEDCGGFAASLSFRKSLLEAANETMCVVIFFFLSIFYMYGKKDENYIHVGN